MLTSVVALLAGCSGSEPVAKASLDPLAALPALMGQRGRGEISPEWHPGRLDPNGTSLQVVVLRPCGSQWKEFDHEVEERADAVLISVRAFEIVQGGCEMVDLGRPVDIELDAPLGDRPIIDASDPGRELRWGIPPGSVQVRPVVTADPAAIAADVPETTMLVLGHEVPQIPLTMQQVREGFAGLVPFVVDLTPPIVGVYGFIDEVPLEPDAPMQGTVEIAPPASPEPEQLLAIHLGAGAITMGPAGPVLDIARVTFSWHAAE